MVWIPAIQSLQVSEEGLYGFTLVAHNGVGGGKEPPHAGDLPQIWVLVDQTKPDAICCDFKFAVPNVSLEDPSDKPGRGALETRITGPVSRRQRASAAQGPGKASRPLWITPQTSLNSTS